ncbi:MAG: hypothetical protein RBT71_01810 [Flavobacteriales bacterium]|jgi:hypothetical protein|nr:hypothetical protein [Flavobacteriales bacterium]
MDRRTPFRFLGRAMAFGALLLAVLALVAWSGPPVTPVDFTAASIAKHARARAVGSPKVLLVGGSNVAFGVASGTVEEALCMPVVNLALHAGLGFGYMKNEAVRFMGPGDLVIVALEESNYTDPVKDHEVLYQMVDRHPDALRFVPWWDRPRIMAGLLVLRLQSAWKKATGLWTYAKGHPLYRADGFDARGDMVAHIELPRPAALQDDGLEPVQDAVSDRFAPLADDLERHARAVGAEVVYTWPGRARSGYDAARSAAILATLHEQGRAVLGRPEQFVFPDSMCHDTRYHLRGEGRAERTRRLLVELCRARPGRCCTTPAD